MVFCKRGFLAVAAILVTSQGYAMFPPGKDFDLEKKGFDSKHLLEKIVDTKRQKYMQDRKRELMDRLVALKKKSTNEVYPEKK
jgi:hypothetical protein